MRKCWGGCGTLTDGRYCGGARCVRRDAPPEFVPIDPSEKSSLDRALEEIAESDRRMRQALRE